MKKANKKDQKAKKELELIDIYKYVDNENRDIPFYSKTIIISAICITCAILVAVTIILVVKYFS